MTTTPMNFRVPAELKAEFEATCRRLTIPMTAQLNQMMREFVRSETARLQQDAVDNGPIQFFSNFQ